MRVGSEAPRFDHEGLRRCRVDLTQSLLKRCGDNNTIGHGQRCIDGPHGDAAANEDRGLGERCLETLHLGQIGWLTRAWACDNDAVGTASFDTVLGLHDDVPRHERYRVFHMNVSQDTRISTQPLAVPDCLVGRSHEQSLVRDGCSGVHVDADDPAAAGNGRGQGITSGIAKQIHAAGSPIGEFSHQDADDPHHVGVDVVGVERNVPEVFEHDAVKSRIPEHSR